MRDPGCGVFPLPMNALDYCPRLSEQLGVCLVAGCFLTGPHEWMTGGILNDRHGQLWKKEGSDCECQLFKGRGWNLDYWIKCPKADNINKGYLYNLEIATAALPGSEVDVQYAETGSITGWVAPGFSYGGIVADDVAGRRFFSGVFRFPRPCSPALLHTHLASPSWLSRPRCRRAAQISSLTQISGPGGSVSSSHVTSSWVLITACLHMGYRNLCLLGQGRADLCTQPVSHVEAFGKLNFCPKLSPELMEKEEDFKYFRALSWNVYVINCQIPKAHFGQRICRPYSDHVNVTSLEAEFWTRPRTEKLKIVDMTFHSSSPSLHPVSLISYWSSFGSWAERRPRVVDTAVRHNHTVDIWYLLHVFRQLVDAETHELGGAAAACAEAIMTASFLQDVLGVHYMIDCGRLSERPLCLIGYCIPRKVPYWLSCWVTSTLPCPDWRTAFEHNTDQAAGRKTMKSSLAGLWEGEVTTTRPPGRRSSDTARWLQLVVRVGCAGHCLRHCRCQHRRKGRHWFLVLGVVVVMVVAVMVVHMAPAVVVSDCNTHEDNTLKTSKGHSSTNIFFFCQSNSKVDFRLGLTRLPSVGLAEWNDSVERERRGNEVKLEKQWNARVGKQECPEKTNWLTAMFSKFPIRESGLVRLGLGRIICLFNHHGRQGVRTLSPWGRKIPSSRIPSVSSQSTAAMVSPDILQCAVCMPMRDTMRSDCGSHYPGSPKFVFDITTHDVRCPTTGISNRSESKLKLQRNFPCDLRTLRFGKRKKLATSFVEEAPAKPTAATRVADKQRVLYAIHEPGELCSLGRSPFCAATELKEKTLKRRRPYTFFFIFLYQLSAAMKGRSISVHDARSAIVRRAKTYVLEQQLTPDFSGAARPTFSCVNYSFKLEQGAIRQISGTTTDDHQCSPNSIPALKQTVNFRLQATCERGYDDWPVRLWR
ncbi:hypothetical protein PR048_028862 [Dryococelus australis]|uniref:Uncharacterized protein n=1 Tax=Dryococelus australis TaxID=614101 RepID=A0ABQ9GC62_9NEOP|nr:hypothetical protein PR048_028862 [Dryococelus australis]